MLLLSGAVVTKPVFFSASLLAPTKDVEQTFKNGAVVTQLLLDSADSIHNNTSWRVIILRLDPQ